ncbi:MAG TPA: alcohol dehydrogenase catalytic domain-containing protein, partial [Acidimicrobiales bacterium]|nr:alcohol dehydrogenase catalytic domain-containing protein [Acidimicrobiales bacterium]
MRAATIVDGTIVVAEHPDPEPGTGEVLVRVRAAGLNNADLLQVRGMYPAPPGVPADIPGLELAGEVAACGPKVERFQPGDRVMAVVAGGGQAELAVVHERT